MNIVHTKLSYIVKIPRLYDEAYLSFAQENDHIPFPMKRIYFISHVENDMVRGKHAHRQTKQVLFCIQGNVTIILDNGKEREEVRLSEPNLGIYLDAMIWHEMVGFDKETILLVVASDIYRESDYIRDYTSFITLTSSL